MLCGHADMWCLLCGCRWCLPVAQAPPGQGAWAGAGEVGPADSCSGGGRQRVGAAGGAGQAPVGDNLLGQLVHSRRWGRGLTACYEEFYGLWTKSPQAMKAHAALAVAAVHAKAAACDE